MIDRLMMALRRSAALSLLLLAALASAARGVNLRTDDGVGDRRRLSQSESGECTVVLVQLLAIEPGTIEDQIFECEMDPVDMKGKRGRSLEIKASPRQMKALKDLHDSGDLIPGESRLNIGPAQFDDGFLFLPPGLVIAASLRKNPKEQQQRRLANSWASGTRPVLAVRVIDMNGLAYPHTAEQMSHNIFGPSNFDQVNLKSQLEACSYGKLTIEPGVGASYEETGAGAPGMIEVTINLAIDGRGRGRPRPPPSRITIRDAITDAVEAKIGTSLPGPYSHVMYILEGCYGSECGWAAYAYVPGSLSVYQNWYYYASGVQVHEFGHNFGAYHSGGLDGQTYTDHTCLLGNPLYSDEVGKMCFNPAKNWYLQWYDDAHVALSSADFPQEVTMVGVGEYDLRGNKPVVMKLETGVNPDLYVAFNRATGPNAQNDQADDQVTIVEATNDSRSRQSFLKETLQQDQTYTHTGFAGASLYITAKTIDIGTTPGTATICISRTTVGGKAYCPQTAPDPTSPPTQSPSSPPTESPTGNPTSSPTVTAKPTDPPTSSPTRSPSVSPTAGPTASPMDPGPPTDPPTASPTRPPTGSPTAGPTPGPTDPTGCGGPGTECSSNSDCCNGCIQGGPNAGACT